MIHVPIVERGHTNDNAFGGDSFKSLHVHKKANQFNTDMTRRIVVIKAIGEPVSSKGGLSKMIIYIGIYCGSDLANMIINSANGCRRHGSSVSKTILLLLSSKLFRVMVHVAS